MLALEVWRRDDVGTDSFLLCVAVLCLFALGLAYCANLIQAVRIRYRDRVIGSNEVARTWFEQRGHVFMALVLVTGDCHCALQMVSSNLFGIASLSSGLTRFELKQMGAVKLSPSVYTVFLRNIPQLFVQAMYALLIGRITNMTLFALLTSMLSRIVFLPALVECRFSDDIDSKVPTQYYLSLEWANALTSSERANIVKHRQRRLRLSRWLAALWETEPECVEIGSTVLGHSGAKIHIVHYVEAGHERTIAEDYANREMQSRVSRVMTAHFELSGEFEVKCITFEKWIAMRKVDSVEEASITA